MLFSLNPTTASIQLTPSFPDKMETRLSLPSFNELLTSIPLPHEFKRQLQPQQLHTTQQPAVHQIPTGSIASSQPYNYYLVSNGVNTTLQHLHTMPYARQPSPPTKANVQGSPLSLVPYPVGQPIVSPAYSYQPPQYSYYQDPRQVVAPAGYHYQVMPGAPIQNSRPQHVIDHQHHSLESKVRSNSLESSSSTSSVGSSSSKDPKRKHVCKVCARSFTTSGHLARHNRIHTGERKHVCPWPTCTARFARQDNCMQHYKTHTNGKNKRSKIANTLKDTLAPGTYV